MRRLCLAALLLSACTATPAPSPSAQPPAASAAEGSAPPVAIGAKPATQRVSLDGGLVLDAPSAWYVSKPREVNRATQRLTMVSNVEPNALPTLPGNGDVDAGALAPGTVSVEVEEFCRMSCQGPTAESSLPLDWGTATALYTRSLPAGRHEMAVSFRWFDAPVYVVARWAEDPSTPAAAIPAIVQSVRADPMPPPSGEYFGWINAGQLDAISIGDVRRVPLPSSVPRTGRLPDDTPFFLVRGKVSVYAFVSRALVDEHCEIDYDPPSDQFRCVVSGRTYEWSRFGLYLGPEPASALPQHRVIVRDGTLWVRYDRDSLITPPIEPAER
jgi:hypothetical protein